MTAYRALLTLGTLAVSLGASSTAKANTEIALSFELPPASQEEAEPTAIAAATSAPPEVEVRAAESEQPEDSQVVSLPIPPGAENPPMASDRDRPAGVYGGLDAVAIGTVPSVHALLPPPPPIPDHLQQAVTAIVPSPLPEAPLPGSVQLSKTDIKERVALFFDVEKPAVTSEDAETEIVSPPPETVPVASLSHSLENLTSLFEGGTDSLVAWAVGSAEGTRTPEGHKNPAYFGHVDPGNGVWNMGTFSYQHGANTPEEADEKQLRRLQSQTEQLQQQALDKGLQLSQEELVNGIDLANQAPLAALDRGGYLDWLQEARQLGMSGSEAIVWARTRSFIDPDTQRWNAPGLGNNIHSISHDQERRANAIARAIDAFTAKFQVPAGPVAEPILMAAEPPTEAIASAIDDVAFGLEQFSNTALKAKAENQDNAATSTASLPPEVSEPSKEAEATVETEVGTSSPATVDALTGAPLVAGLSQSRELTAAIAPAEPGRPVFNWLSRALAKIASPSAIPLSTEVSPTAISSNTLPQEFKDENVEPADVSTADSLKISDTEEIPDEAVAIASDSLPASADSLGPNSEFAHQLEDDTTDTAPPASRTPDPSFTNISVAARNAPTELEKEPSEISNGEALVTAPPASRKSSSTSIFATAFARPQILRPEDALDEPASNDLTGEIVAEATVATPSASLTFSEPGTNAASANRDSALTSTATEIVEEASATATDAELKRTALAALDRLEQTLRQVESGPATP
ncbi:MAG: hypothetical protein ACFB0E_13310 [Leptolyngbyaceae cyanobacterium]